MKEQIVVRNLDGIDTAAAEFLRRTEGRRLIALYGAMGAGKTTFTSAICRCLGVRSDAVSSPTFSIVNEYRTGSGEPMFHFDFYRISRLSEAFDIGFSDYVDSGLLCIMEWPENVEEILPDETLKVHIAVNSDGSRTLTWEV